MKNFDGDHSHHQDYESRHLFCAEYFIYYMLYFIEYIYILLWQVSYDDTIYKATILMNVEMAYDEKTELYSIPKKYIHETKQLLKQSLHDDQAVDYETSDDNEEVYSMADNAGKVGGSYLTHFKPMFHFCTS